MNLLSATSLPLAITANMSKFLHTTEWTLWEIIAYCRYLGMFAVVASGKLVALSRFVTTFFF